MRAAAPAGQKPLCLASLFLGLFVFLSLLSVLPWALACLIAPFSHAVDQQLGIAGSPGRVMLVTAHPDDESLFFAPTITALEDAGSEVFLMCVTTGDAHGKGELRRAELHAAAQALQIDAMHLVQLNNTQLQDGHDTIWNSTLVASLIMEQVQAREINTLISFDPQGVTGHANHRAISAGVHTLVEGCRGREDCPAAWQLVSSGRWQKYTSLLDALPTTEQEDVVQTACYLNRKLLRSYRAFYAHHSQWRWWRHLLFSRFSYINTLQRVS